MKKEILYTNPVGTVCEKTTYEKRCRVVYRNGKHIMREYRFYNNPSFKSQYLSWINLDQCGGWHTDKSYLYSAVQNGKKLYAGITFSTYKTDCEENQKVASLIAELKNTLPESCVFGKEEHGFGGIDNVIFNHYFICRKGKLTDFIDLEEVVAIYNEHECGLFPETEEELRFYANQELSKFSSKKFYEYFNPETEAQLIFTGLLLGYPVESTISLISE